MEVESDEEDEKQEKTEEPPAQPDQDTQVQDMDEVTRQQNQRYLCPVQGVWFTVPFTFTVRSSSVS